MRVDIIIIKKLILIIKYNFKYLSSISFIHYGIGIYPGTIFINHSCLPNSVGCVKNNGKVIEYRAVSDIKIGEEITCSYVEEYETREHRQKFLLKNYHFKCKCLRCVVPFSESVDRYLNGFYCNECKNELTVVKEKEKREKEEEEKEDNEEEGEDEDKSNNNEKYECIKCKKIYEKKYLINKYKKISEFFLNARSVIKYNKRESMNIIKQIIESNDISYLNPYHTKTIRIYMVYLVLSMESKSHQEFVIYWNKMLDSYKYILGKDFLSLLSLYILFIKEFMTNFREDDHDSSSDELRVALRNIEEGDRIARNCCGSNHEISEFTHAMSESV